jgi:hypothetical protein
VVLDLPLNINFLGLLPIAVVVVIAGLIIYMQIDPVVRDEYGRKSEKRKFVDGMVFLVAGIIIAAFIVLTSYQTITFVKNLVDNF